MPHVDLLVLCNYLFFLNSKHYTLLLLNIISDYTLHQEFSIRLSSCQIRFTVYQPNYFSVCTHPQILEEARLLARWFKSSSSLGKYEHRRNNCSPESHQDALKQSIYPSIYPQMVPLELLSGQL